MQITKQDFKRLRLSFGFFLLVMISLSIFLYKVELQKIETAKEVIKQVNLINLITADIEEFASEDFPTPPAHVSIIDKNY